MKKIAAVALLALAVGFLIDIPVAMSTEPEDFIMRTIVWNARKLPRKPGPYMRDGEMEKNSLYDDFWEMMKNPEDRFFSKRISADLGNRLIRAWDAKALETHLETVELTVRIDTYEKKVVVRTSPYDGRPAVFWEEKIPIKSIVEDTYFSVFVSRVTSGCTVVYPRGRSVETRRGELARKRNGGSTNFHIFLLC